MALLAPLSGAPARAVTPAFSLAFHPRADSREHHVPPPFRSHCRHRLCVHHHHLVAPETAQGPCVRISDRKHEPLSPTSGNNRHFGPKSRFCSRQRRPRPARQAPLPRVRPPSTQAEPLSKMTKTKFLQSEVIFSEEHIFFEHPKTVRAGHIWVTAEPRGLKWPTKSFRGQKPPQGDQKR